MEVDDIIQAFGTGAKLYGGRHWDLRMWLGKPGARLGNRGLRCGDGGEGVAGKRNELIG